MRSLTLMAQTMPTANPLGKRAAAVRILDPFHYLNLLPDVRCVAWTEHRPMPVPDPDADNIFISQRIFYTTPADRFHETRNFLTVFEMDDNPFALGWDLEMVVGNICGYHAIQTSTPELADRFREYHPEVAVFGNHLHSIRPFNRRVPGGTIKILFAAVSREAGWRAIMPAYREVLAAHGNRIETIVVGDRGFFDALGECRKVFHPVLPYEDYRAMLDASDIALLPLADNAFDRCKSDLKFLECAEAGVPVLASHVVYGDTVKPEKTGFIYRDAEEFKRHLHALIDSFDMRARIATAAYDYVSSERRLADRAGDRLPWYKSLVDRKDELEQTRQERVDRHHPCGGPHTGAAAAVRPHNL